MSSSIKSQEELRSLLNEEYSQENWKKITEFVFPNVSYLQKPQDIPFKSDKVETFRQIGNVKLNDGKNLAMFEVHVSEHVNIANNKIELRKLVAPLIDQELNHGVLVIYEQGKDDYRFTFTAKRTEFSAEDGDFINIETDAKRFTYILGKNETCKTAASRFWELSENKDTATMEVVQDAFSVEQLNDEFFNRYKKLYQDFVQFISGKRFVLEKTKKGKEAKEVLVTLSKASAYYKDIFKKDDVKVRNFIKILLGRLVFIQFLQKKGWMGAPLSNNKWNGGDKHFVQNFYMSFKKKENFHSKGLYHLFHGALNTPNRPNDIFDLTDSRVPYLNGGLFENDFAAVNKIDFPENLFEELFDFFSQYNFTIDESDSFEQEVGIDPEMLGHIFENLLDDNKSNGTYYTPKVIVKYMCKESILEYLCKKLNADVHKRRSLSKLIKGYDDNRTSDFRFDTEFVPVMNALKEVKICDPAIGSGAFPMGILMEIFEIVELFCNEKDAMKIWDVDNWEEDKSMVKLNIIQNSIYGVDIEKGAVDIARLRFWLSLVVDEQEPRALPNLDYKIVVGDSLVPKLDGEILEVDWDVKSTSSTKSIADKIAFELNELLLAQKGFFEESDLSKKIKLQKRIRNIKINLLINQLKLDKLIYTANKVSNEKMFELTKIEKEEQKEIELKLNKFDEAINKLNNAKSNENIALNYFDWKLDFPEILNSQIAGKNKGFDIVIANPPYIDSETMIGSGNEDVRTYLTKNLTFTKGNWDIYIAFFEMGFNFLNENGNLVYITPDKWISKPFGYELRKGLMKNYFAIAEAGRKVFKTAKVDSIITSIAKYPKSTLNILRFEKSSIIELGEADKNLFTEPFALDWLFSSNINLMRKIENCSLTLNHFGECENACATSDAYKLKEYLIDLKPNSFNKESHLKIINTGTIGKYVSRWGVKSMTYLGDKYERPSVNKKKFTKDFSNSYGIKSVKPKLIIKGLTLLDACIDEEGIIIPGKTTLIIAKEDSEDLKFLLAFINSKLPLFYLKEKYRGSSYNTGINFSTEMINLIPIPSISRKSINKFITKVNNILVLLSQDKSTSKIVDELNKMVYKLYKLNFDEILLIDPDFALENTKESFENITYNFEYIDVVHEAINKNKNVKSKSKRKINTTNSPELNFE